MQADQATVSRLLKTARGQIDGILNMVESGRYCLDISQQIMAAQAMLARANREVLTAHVTHCVQNARSDEERQEKSQELAKVLEKIIK